PVAAVAAQQHPPAAAGGAGVHGGLQGRGVQGVSVADGAVVRRVEGAGAGHADQERSPWAWLKNWSTPALSDTLPKAMSSLVLWNRVRMALSPLGGMA